jgi:site-specific DNA-methyltransferase (adenine-specific)
MSSVSIIQGDCLQEMPKLEAKSVDMILTDLPYGMTNNHWDSQLPLNALWIQFKRIIKEKGAIVLFADEPFTSLLITSNLENFKYRLVWDKDTGGGFLNAKIMPLKQTEDICVFGYGTINYYPILKKKPLNRVRPISFTGRQSENYGEVKVKKPSEGYDNTLNYPTNLLKFPSHNGECNPQNIIHPTQKPVKLFEYLIKTYSKEGNLILDCCAGSGTTAVACLNSNRRYTCIEKEQFYFEVMKQRVASNKVSPSQIKLFTLTEVS